MGIKMELYLIVVIIKAPLPSPSRTTARGKTQHREAMIADGRLVRTGFKLEILIVYPQYHLPGFHSVLGDVEVASLMSRTPCLALLSPFLFSVHESTSFAGVVSASILVLGFLHHSLQLA
jgi:hypothetical protein